MKKKENVSKEDIDLLVAEIDQKRKELNELGKIFSGVSAELLKTSEELDVLIVRQTRLMLALKVRKPSA